MAYPQRIASLILCALGCASNNYHAYKQSHSDWVPVFPSTDIGLDETVAAIYAPPNADYQRIVSKLRIFRTDTVPWQEIAAADLASGAFVPNEAEDYAVAVLVWCSSEVALERYNSERASWYLLPKNRVGPYDHFDFAERCVIFDDYRPASGAAIEVERKLVHDVASGMTRSPVHPGHLYAKGVRLAEVGRIDEAREMLKAGDEVADPTAKPGEPRFDAGRSVSVGGADEVAQVRAQLVDALEREDPTNAVPPPAESR